MSVPVKVGEPIRLLFQMEDGEGSLPLVVRATLRNETGSVFDEVELTHIGDGLFRNSAIFLEDQEEVVATFKVFSEDGLELNRDFVVESTRFIKDTSTGGSSGGGTMTIIGNEFVVEVDDVQ